MANNANVNKVEYGGNTLIDLTGDTVTPADVLSGVTAHDRSGAAITGTLVPVLQSDIANGTRVVNGGFVLDARQGAKLDELDGRITKILTGQVGASLVVPYSASKGVEAVLIYKPPVQTGSGTPSGSNIRPFVVGTDPSISYSYKLPGGSSWVVVVIEAASSGDYNICGAMYDIQTGGFFLTHGYIASYSGEKLPGKWLSDRDVYAKGRTPTTGAAVAYELPEPIEVETLGDSFAFSTEGDYEFESDETGGHVVARMYPVTAEKIDESAIANNLTTTASGKVLDARQGKALSDAVDAIGGVETLGYVQNTGSTSLSKAVTNFRLIQVRVGYYNSGFPNYGSLIVPTSNINLTSDTTYDYVIPCIDNGAIKQIKFGLTSSTEAHVSVNDISGAYVRVIGIK